MWKLAAAILLVAAVVAAGLMLQASRPDEQSTEKQIRVASATPSATDMLLRMDIGDRLVARSAFDDDPKLTLLPIAGDARQIDWERLAKVRPDILVIGTDERLLTPADRSAAAELGIQIVPAIVRRLDDVRPTLDRLAQAAGLSLAAASAFEDELAEALATEPAEDERPRVLVLLNADLTFVAGRGNYIDDVLQAAGADNAVSAESLPWPTLDQEALVATKPDAVVLLLPSANDAVLRRARAKLDRYAQAGGDAWTSATIVTKRLVMTPGWTGIIELAQTLSQVVETIRSSSLP